MNKPEALRLAEVAPYLEGGERGQWIVAAAAELRRLHAVNVDLLTALKAICKANQLDYVPDWISLWSQADAAITKAEGDTQ